MMPWAFLLILITTNGPCSMPFATAEACHQAKLWATSSAVRAECFPTGSATISHIEE